MFRKFLQRYILVLFSLVLIVAAITSGTLAWQSLGQAAANVLSGSSPPICWVQLYKTDQNGKPIPGAEFTLHEVGGEQIGGIYTTDEDGRIILPDKLPKGEYYFEEVTPPVGYTYALDDAGWPVFFYPFTVEKGDTLLEVKAENLYIGDDGSLLLHNIVKNEDGSPLTDEQLALPFTYHVNFSEDSDEGYTYVIFGGGIREYGEIPGNDGEIPSYMDTKTIRSGETLQLSHGQTAIFYDIPNGVLYNITQDPMPDYRTESTGHQGTIRDNEARAIFINIYAEKEAEPGNLTITKEVAGENADSAVNFDFIAVVGGVEHSFTLRAGQSHTIDNLPIGTAYTVYEAAEEGWSSLTERYSGKIASDEEVLLPFVNVPEEDTDETGSLTITKQINGDSNPADRFTVEVLFSDSAEYPYTIDGETFTLSETNTLTLAAGETAVFENIPHGVRYSILETDSAGYIAVTGGIAGTIIGSQTAEAVIVNEMEHPDEETAILQITKKLSGENIPAADWEKDFSFTLTVTNPEPELGEDALLLEETFTLKPGEVYEAEIPAGMTYEVREEDYLTDGYTQTIENGFGIAPVQGETVTVTAVNTFHIEDLIEKIDISGTKTWDHRNNPEEYPTEITVHLYKGIPVEENPEKPEDDEPEEIRELVDSVTVVPDDNDEWKYTFADLLKYDENDEEIVYVVEEEPVYNYISEVDGYDIHNVYMPTISISGEKTWNHGDNPEDEWPEEITVYLYQNEESEPFRECVVKPDEESGKWVYTFDELPRYDENGNENIYRIGEADVDGYSSTVDGYNLHNTYDRYITISGKKTWIHKGYEEQCPESIVVNLCVGETVIERQEVRADENGEWKYTFPAAPEDKLPKYDEYGEVIPYTINEDSVEGYICEVKGYDLYNTYDLSRETIDITGTKTWEHGDSPEENHPDRITVLLYAADELIDEQEIRAEDNWKYTFAELPKYDEKDQEIVYTIDEMEVENYKKTIQKTDIGYDLVNTYDPSPEDETIDISGVKTWEHGNNPNPPESVKVYLYADGTELDWCIADADTDWAYSFTDLPKYNSGGVEIRYSIKEEPIAGYVTEVNGYNLHNRFEDQSYDETIDISGIKTWDHGSNPAEQQPKSVTVYLLADGEIQNSRIVTADDGWSYTFTGLPVYDEYRQPITYTIAEEPVPGYETVISGYNLLNTHESAELPETITISGIKYWEHRDNPKAKWPQSVTVILYGDGEEIEQKIVTEADGWSYTFENLPKYNQDEEEIRYRIEEKPIDDYRTEYEDYDIINIYDPLISIEGEKIWEHRSNPKSEWPDEITVYLYADGERIDRLTVDASDDWRYCFDDLPMYDEDGDEIEYEVEEKSVENYRTEYSGYDIINIHDPLIDISGTKTWEHRNNPASDWPSWVNVFLYADGEQLDWYTVTEEHDNWTYHFNDLPMYDKYGKEIRYEVQEEPVDGYRTIIDGYDILNVHDPVIHIFGEKIWEHRDNTEEPYELDIYLYGNGELLDWKTVTKWDDWMYDFGEYPMYDEDGEPIRYEIEEDPVKDYTVIREGFNLINVYNPTTSVTVTKIWEHLGNPEENRPESVVVYLFADEMLIAQTELTAETDWMYTFDDLPVYDETGDKILYTVDERDVEGYTKYIDGHTIINTYEAKVTVSGVKTWDHRDNPMENQPKSITVYLFAGNDLIAQKEVTAADNWTYDFGEYPEYDENGVRIQYSIDESTVEGYTKVIDGYDLYNTYTPVINISGAKIWEHRDNPAENQPKSLVIYLFADRDLTAQTEISAETDWNYTFSNMPKYNEDGSVIQYTVDERTTDGYSKVIDGLTITNTYNPLITVSGTKIWNHGNNPVGERPASIIVYLFANGDLVVQSEITAEDNWTFRFTDLPKYDENGTLIQYTVDERTVIGYTKEINGFNITNTWEEEYYPDTEDTNIPQTGDDSDLMPWILLFILTSCGFAVVIYIIWQKTRKER